MKPKTHLEANNLIKELIIKLQELPADDVTARITVPNDNILKLISADYSAHIYAPFEMGGNESSYIWIIKGNSSIRVESEDKFRKETILKAY